MNQESFTLALSFMSFGGLLAFLSTIYLWINPIDLTEENTLSKIYPFAFDVYIFGSTAFIVGLMSFIAIIVGHLFGFR